MKILTMICALTVALLPLAAQTSLGTSSVAGKVRDASGLPVGGANVALTDLQRGAVRRTVTNDLGNYIFPAVTPGFYKLEMTKQGFEPYSVSNFQVLVAQTASMDAVLQVGGVSQSISVNAQGAAPLLDTASNSLGTVVDRQRVENLPLNGRNFLQLGLIAGGSAVPQGVSTIVANQTGREDRSIHIGGNFEGVTSYLINGIATRGSRIGESSLNLSVAAIDQFKVQMSFFMPDQGPDPGIVNVYTKSGTNGLHGEAYEYVRNSAMDARNFFAPAPEPLQRNQFGFALGGPVYIPHVVNGKDKLWFFVNYEGERQIQQFSQGAFTPTAAMFGGDFSQFPQTIYDPLTYDPKTGLRSPFPNNQIPGDRINPVARNMEKYYLPGSSFFQRPLNLFANPRNTLNDDQYGIRIDEAISDRQNLSGSFFSENSPEVAGAIMPLAGRSYPLDTQVFTLQHTFSISPTLVNVARLGFSRSTVFFTGQLGPSPTLAQDVGITGTVDPSGLPSTTIQGFSGFGSGFGPVGDADNNYQLDDALNKSKGNHNFQFGTGIRYHRTKQLNANSAARGNLSFQSIFTAQLAPNAAGKPAPVNNTGSGMADFLLGMPASGITAGLPPIYYRFTQFMPYFQDSWRVRPSLTLNYGVSWYYSTVPNPQGAARNQMADLNFQTGLLQYSALGQVNPEIMRPDRYDFTPRFGLAWQPNFLKNTVIRSGWGVYYADDRVIELSRGMLVPPFTNPLFIVNSPLDPLPTYTLGQNTFPPANFPPLTPSFAANLAPGTSPSVLDPNNRTPYVMQWNFSIQHTIHRNNLVELDYMGTSGHDQQNRYDANQCQVGPSLLCNPATRPLPRYNTILYGENNGNISYNALVVKYHHEFSRGLTLQADYTFSKVLTNSWEGGGATQSQITDCLACDRGPAAFNVPQMLTISTVYELPFGRGKQFARNARKLLDLAIGGWNVSAITTFATGDTITVNAPNTTSSAYADVRANRLCNGADSAFAGNLRSNGLVDFNRSCFVSPAAGYFGTSGRGVLVGPGRNNWDIGFWKRFAITEHTGLALRGDFFNAFNHAQFGNPSVNTGDVNFGRVASAAAPRLIQLSATLDW